MVGAFFVSDAIAMIVSVVTSGQAFFCAEPLRPSVSRCPVLTAVVGFGVCIDGGVVWW